MRGEEERSQWTHTQSGIRTHTHVHTQTDIQTQRERQREREIEVNAVCAMCCVMKV